MAYMRKVIFINICRDGSFSGVQRYIECLTSSLSYNKTILVYLIEITSSRSIIYEKRCTNGNFTKIIIPLPKDELRLFRCSYDLLRYFDWVWNQLLDCFDENDNTVIHVNSLNAIDLALKMKSFFIKSKIITHLHCIPWKNCYNTDIKRFNKLYSNYYIDINEEKHKEEFMVCQSEYDSYVKSDMIICATECAKTFLIKVFNIECAKIKIIVNGIEDAYLPSNRVCNSKINILVVGSIIQSKGVEYILKAVDIIDKLGISVHLTFVGYGSKIYVEYLKSMYSNLSVEFRGLLNFKELADVYRSCDIGLMISMQEQCSYAAIEMAMFKKPIIITNVDGLDEMFTDNLDCLKVNTYFDESGLHIDPFILAEKIMLLIKDEALCDKIATNARNKYLDKYRIHDMYAATLALYTELFEC